MHHDYDMLRMTSHRFIDRVIDDLPHEMMETTLIGRSDVHTRTFTDGLESLEDLDITTVIGSAGHRRDGLFREVYYRKIGESKARMRISFVYDLTYVYLDILS